MCQPCSSLCSACWGTAANCTACDSATNHRIISAVNTCVCASGYVDVGATACLACFLPCLTCSLLPNNCTSCNAERTLSSESCLCKSGTFRDLCFCRSVLSASLTHPKCRPLLQSSSLCYGISTASFHVLTYFMSGSLFESTSFFLLSRSYSWSSVCPILKDQD